jgi:hypothetical protein
MRLDKGTGGNSTNYKFVFGTNKGTGEMDIEATGNMFAAGNAFVGGSLYASNNLHANGTNITLGAGTGPEYVVLRQDGSRVLHLVPWGGSGYAFDEVCVGCGGQPVNFRTTGNLTVDGTCNASIEGDDVASSGETCTAGNITTGSLTTGAVIEANLMTQAEQAAGRIDRFTQGDVQCWSTKTERLEKCDQANTRLVMAIADANGLPIVQGAEPVKVLGPVVAGELLVASAVPGYAMVNNNPVPGTIIGKALEDFNGESGLIKVWIHQ